MHLKTKHRTRGKNILVLFSVLLGTSSIILGVIIGLPSTAYAHAQACSSENVCKSNMLPGVLIPNVGPPPPEGGTVQSAPTYIYPTATPIPQACASATGVRVQKEFPLPNSTWTRMTIANRTFTLEGIIVGEYAQTNNNSMIYCGTLHGGGMLIDDTTGNIATILANQTIDTNYIAPSIDSSRSVYGSSPSKDKFGVIVGQIDDTGHPIPDKVISIYDDQATCATVTVSFVFSSDPRVGTMGGTTKPASKCLPLTLPVS